MAEQGSIENSGETAPSVSREEIVELIAEISRRVVESDRSSMHCMLALNHLLNHPNIGAVLTDDLRGQIKDLWVKLKSTGIVLADPPIIFGYQKTQVDGHTVCP